MTEATFNTGLGQISAAAGFLKKIENEGTEDQKKFVNNFLDGQRNVSEKVARISSKISSKIQEIRKYDVIYVEVPNTTHHYAVVFKVQGDKVYALNITSRETLFADHLITKSRMFNGNYFSSYLTIVSLDKALKSFQFVYSEGRKEFNETVKKVGQMYQSIF